jgi:transposase-like protein
VALPSGDRAVFCLSQNAAHWKGKWTYLYRALDSEGNTIDFMLSPYRDRIAAKRFLQLALSHVRHPRPRVINVDGHPAYPSVIDELKQTGELSKICRCRRSPYMNNLIEQDHRFIKKRIVASQWFRSVQGAVNTIQGIRSNAHDSQGADPVATEGRYRRSGPICEPCLRPCCLISLPQPTRTRAAAFATLPT